MFPLVAKSVNFMVLSYCIDLVSCSIASSVQSYAVQDKNIKTISVLERNLESVIQKNRNKTKKNNILVKKY